MVGISNLDTRVQQKALEQHFANWKGAHEQVDDVCVFGIKLGTNL